MTTLLDYDLAVRRGGNKYRLIARSYVALMNEGKARNCTQAYAAFRDEHEGWTFEALHNAYDRVLPAQYRAKTGNQYGNAGRGRQAKQANGMTEAQQAKFDRFCKAPARLEKRFNKTAEYFLSNVESATDGGQHLRAVAKRYQAAADYCANLIGDTQDLAMLWSLGMRTGGDLEMQIERTLRI
jgi:hypothetical protein